MAHQLAQFTLYDMAECCLRLRSMGKHAATMEAAAQASVDYLFDELVAAGGGPAFERLWILKTHPFAELTAPQKAQVRDDLAAYRHTVGRDPDWRKLQCLVRMASRGEEAGLRGAIVALMGAEPLAKEPLLEAMVRQLGLFPRQLAAPNVAVIDELAQRTFAAFHVPNIAVLESVTTAARSAVGFGGALYNGDLFFVLGLARDVVSSEAAERFGQLAASLKLALTPLVYREFDSPMEVERAEGAVNHPKSMSLVRIRAQLAATEQLLEVQERFVERRVFRRLEEANQQLGALNATLAAQAAEAKRLAQEAARANVAKTEFLATMSHEIRTPMTGILGMAALLAESGLTPDQAECAETIQQSGESLLAIINDVLDLSKIEAGRLTPENAEFDLRATVAAAIALVAENAQRKQLELTVDFAADVPSHIAADAGRLRQILLNLLTNAIKFTPAGRVTVRVTAVRLATARYRIQFEVEDSGIGISDAEQKRLFERFAQAEPSTARRYGGTGLGLAICRKLVAYWNGDIGVRSEPGQGSVFWFTLEVAGREISKDVNVPVGSAEMARGVSALGARVLLVDDNPVNQKVGLRFLDRLGCATVCASDGREAVQLFQAGDRFDVVLMDCHMPELDGWMATSEIREIEAAACIAHTPIVALTASVFERDKQRCLAAGMDDFLAKPISLVHLEAALRRWIRPA
jgi:signal transduction histidine kinase/ActR/RegA family two-component response regulator